MKKYEGWLLITDLDGTLLNRKKVISEKNLEAIREFVREGGRYSIATGRSPFSAKRWTDQLPINYPCIYYNGSMVKALEEDEAVVCSHLDRSLFVEKMEWVLQNSPETVVEIFTPEGLFLVSDPANKDPYLEQEKDRYQHASLSDTAGLAWIKILLCDSHENLERVEGQIPGGLTDEDCNHFYSQDFFLEITPAKASKGSCLPVLRSLWRGEKMDGGQEPGAGELSIIAAGDYENDIEMIENAEFGVAMGNSLPCVKAHADYVTVDNDCDSMADILQKWEERKLAEAYLPHFRVDVKEPFPIEGIGYTVFRADGKSPSSPRQFKLPKGCKCLIEYAVYFDYDIQHLYDLEHAFVYVAKDGSVMDVEASFHGMFFKSMINDVLEFEGSHPVLYLQPGKHAVMPDPSYFNLFIERNEVCSELAGSNGFLVAPMFEGRLKTTEEIDRKVEAYMQENYAFTPEFKYQPIELKAGVLMRYEKLDERIVSRLTKWLEEHI